MVVWGVGGRRGGSSGVGGGGAIDDIRGDGAYGVCLGEAVQKEATAGVELIFRNYRDRINGAVAQAPPAFSPKKCYTTAVGPRNNIPPLIESLIPSTLPKTAL